MSESDPSGTQSSIAGRAAGVRTNSLAASRICDGRTAAGSKNRCMELFFANIKSSKAPSDEPSRDRPHHEPPPSSRNRTTAASSRPMPRHNTPVSLCNSTRVGGACTASRLRTSSSSATLSTCRESSECWISNVTTSTLGPVRRRPHSRYKSGRPSRRN